MYYEDSRTPTQLLPEMLIFSFFFTMQNYKYRNQQNRVPLLFTAAKFDK
jgi:hypothetical protein